MSQQPALTIADSPNWNTLVINYTCVFLQRLKKVYIQIELLLELFIGLEVNRLSWGKLIIKQHFEFTDHYRLIVHRNVRLFSGWNIPLMHGAIRWDLKWGRQGDWKSESSVRALQAIPFPLKPPKSKSSFTSAPCPEATLACELLRLKALRACASGRDKSKCCDLVRQPVFQH